ncbi:hypothetical protein IY145_08150 [Methylosinus sp. H3A]|uniref:hypothetical protein n=1 Tax=Methylosinus sp. H3A TaxID=2785786 RepID=UPI0018C1D3E9|nr:hypothetical protein [Methylosinus sp. H3A]MBG0809348.1 hypothetical protein [Methylosinus sp. H3A]
MPPMAARAREQPLPDDVLEVIRIAAGCEETLDLAARLFGRDKSYVKAAAEFYVQQMLFFPAADSHRILGVRPGASRDDMRKHMRWLMIWLHPDHAHAEWKTVFARRVLAAWRDAQNRSEQGMTQAAARRTPTLVRRIPWVPRPIERRRRKFLIPSLFLLAVAIIVIAITVPSSFVEAETSWIATFLLRAVDTGAPKFQPGF